MVRAPALQVPIRRRKQFYPCLVDCPCFLAFSSLSHSTISDGFAIIYTDSKLPGGLEWYEKKGLVVFPRTVPTNTQYLL